MDLKCIDVASVTTCLHLPVSLILWGMYSLDWYVAPIVRVSILNRLVFIKYCIIDRYCQL